MGLKHVAMIGCQCTGLGEDRNQHIYCIICRLGFGNLLGRAAVLRLLGRVSAVVVRRIQSVFWAVSAKIAVFWLLVCCGVCLSACMLLRLCLQPVLLCIVHCMWLAYVCYGTVASEIGYMCSCLATVVSQTAATYNNVFDALHCGVHVATVVLCLSHLRAVMLVSCFTRGRLPGTTTAGHLCYLAALCCFTHQCIGGLVC